MLKMATRLDRLWILLDSGSTPVTRQAAAEQIGEVQKLHPHELNNLLRKVITFLTSKSWETRIAAGQAVEAIVKNVKPWRPVFTGSAGGSRESTPASEDSTLSADLLSFNNFDINQVLAHGTALLSSTGEEYSLDNDPDFQKMTALEKAAFYRQQLLQKLGLVAQGKFFSTGVETFIEDSDLMVTSSAKENPSSKPGGGGGGGGGEVKEISALALKGLSARERNRAKRKARLMARRNSRDKDTPEKTVEGEGPVSKKPRTTNVVVEQAGQTDKLLIDQIADLDSVFEESEEWPLNWFCEEMFRNLFNPSWEVRHGAATALREVIRYHGDTAGLTVHLNPDVYSEANQKWLEDASIRLLCVFALDRFADFVSDQVVAPVRATCAQCLGMCVRGMCEGVVGRVVGVLQCLGEKQQWEVRHASLMAVQHLLAARTDLCATLLPLLSPSILRGLQDVDDDVRAVAASSLLPVANQLVTVLPSEIPQLLTILWDSLVDLDDLSASTSSILGLLCSLLNQNPQLYAGETDEGQRLPQLVPRLWPFLSHTNRSVRLSCLQVLLSLLESGQRKNGGGGGGDRGNIGSGDMDTSEVNEEGMGRSEAGEEKRPTWLGAVLQGALCHLFQRLALEGDKENSDLALQVWENIVGVCDPAELSGACECLLMSWLCLSASPSGSPVDPSLLTRAHQGSHGDVYLGGNIGVESVQRKDEQAFAARVSTAKALGHLAAKMTSSPSPSPVSSTSTPSSDTHSTTPDPTTKTTTTPPQPTSAPGYSNTPTSGYPNPTTPGYFTPASTTLTEGLGQMLTRSSSTHRIVAALTIGYWGVCPSQLLSGLNTILTERTTYEEMMPFLMAMQRECHSLVLAFDKEGISVASGASVSGYTAEYAAQLATTVFEAELQTMSLSAEEKQEFESLRRNVLTALGQLQEELQRRDTRVHCCVTGTLILLASLPPKLNPVIRPLMDCLKSESDPLLQSLAAKWISNLLDLCKERSPSPVTKIIKNLCSFSCVDPRHTPPARPARAGADSTLSEGAVATGKKGAAKSKKKRGSPSGGSANEEAWSSGTGTGGDSTWTWDSGIITLVRQQKELSSHRIPQGRGRPSAAVREALAAAATQQTNLPQQYQRRGGEAALRAVVKYFGECLLSTLPSLWSHITSPLHNLPSPPPATDNAEVPDEVVGAGQAVVNSLQVLEVITPSLHPSLRPRLLSLLPLLLDCIKSTFTAVRHLAARCVATFTLVDLHKSMIFMVEDLLPYLGDSESVTRRQGAIETIACVLESAGLQALCYVVLLVMPVMSRMNDQDEDVRLVASRCFANLVTLMPLEAGTESPKEMPEKLAQKRHTDRRFLEQLLDISKLDNYAVPVPIQADLRQYQQDGINWLAFLNKYSLHGILCDDMGLGKTLQSLCIIAGDHFHREQQYKTTGQVDRVPLPSLVICPPTLIGHWYYEVCKFCRPEDLSPLQYSGPPSTRARLQSLVPNHNLVIASYDIIRNDIDFFRSITWNYCVLDEGHIIKNTKTKITKAVKQLRANHRLILSGTPIQNNVLELWSLFDFLLPGFLGTERQFFERFGKPILLSRDAKSSSKEQEAGALAMESLHKHVLPFLLRRMKEDVLQDLPPKIIQDYHCELSPLQVKLYEDFACSKAKKEVEDTLTEDEEEEEREGEERAVAKVEPPPTHIFQALQYLRKVCNHPALVLNPDHPLFSEVQGHLKKTGSTIKDIRHATKLQALKQLLHDCGVGLEGEEDGEVAAVGQHRILIFCQFKGILDIIESDLFKVHMPTVTYLRLDGSVPANSRFNIVHKFNVDPSVDVLLLTTHVGGLGLNLTGADTVIFFEHDWNPMKDLQAMDRAHRIGQKKVVNVYRLITRGTLEEKIMSLQKFKLNIANTVISQDNSSLRSMNTAELLDLFRLSAGISTTSGANQSTDSSSTGGVGGSRGRSRGKRGEGMKEVLENLPTLWDEEQYKSEYDLSSFMNSLSAAK